MASFPLRRILQTVVILVAVLIGMGVATRLCLDVLYPPLSDMGTQPEAPRLYSDSAVTVLNLPLSIPLADLREAAERYTPTSYEDVDRDFTDMLLDDTLNYDLSRGSITMAIEGNGVTFSFPVTGQVRARGKVNLGLMKIKTSAHAEVAGIISGRIAFKILPDWRIDPDINYTVNITKARIPIKGVGDISLRSFLEDTLSKKIQRRKKKLTEKIMSREIIRDEVGKVWKQMHRVQAIKHDPTIWARVVPKNVGIMPLSAQGEHSLKMGITLTLSTDMALSDEPPPITVSDLPDADILKTIDDTFRLYVPFFADLATLNRYIMKKIEKRNIPMGKGFMLSVSRADLFSNGSNQLTAVVFARIRHLAFGLDTECRLYLNGRLDYDTTLGVIRFTDVSYDAVFSRKTVQVLHWILEPYLRHRIETRLSYPLVPEFIKAHDAINQWIETLVVPPGVSPSLTANPPALLSIAADREGLSTELVLQGHISAALDFRSNDSNRIK